MLRPSDTSDLSLDLRAAFATLTERQRIVVTLYYDGWTQREIGQVLGVSQPAISKLLKRGGHKMTQFVSVVCRNDSA